jgi:hypothetical protein
VSKRTIGSLEDASAYYKRYGDDNEDSISLMDPSIAECYISFSKLLQSEMRRLDKRDSSILQSKMSISVKRHVTNREGTDTSLAFRYKNSSNQGGPNHKKKEAVSEKRGFEE